MKLKEGFLLRQVAGRMMALPVSNDLDMDMMITLNDTGAFLWKQLEKEMDEESLVQAMLAEYDVDEATARKSVTAFIEKLGQNGFFA